ncbi:hypothetical protein IPJ72_06780 [Candidatus Peregrinibacteria bacterium]|nr:MAG: hypothetical protein IPJ72_06780 [Candidatus Peregrinibacteria bacterium]
MNENDLKRALVLYGMKRRQARVFLSLIKRLEANLTQLVNDTGIARATVYLDLNTLEKEGLVSHFKKNGVTYFTPESLNKLKIILQQKEAVIDQALPFMKAMMANAGAGSSMRLVKGTAGIISIWEEILDAYQAGLSDVYAFSNLEKLFALMPRYFPRFLEKEARFPVYIWLIADATASPQAFATLQSNPRAHLKFILPHSAFPGEITIYGNKIAFFYAEQSSPQAFVIESAEVADMQKKIFLLLWNTLPEETPIVPGA